MALTNDIETAKFTFENVFDPAHTLHGDKNRSTHVTSEDIIKARQEGYNEGFQAGKTDEEHTQNKELNAQLEHITASLNQLAQTTAHIEQEAQAQAKNLALLLARKLVFNLNKIHPTQGIETLIEDSLKQLSSAPHIVVRLNEAQVETLQTKISKISSQLGCNDKVMVVPDPDIAKSDCRIEWADGGIERNTAHIEKQIEEIIDRYFPLSCETENGETPTSQPAEGDKT